MRICLSVGSFPTPELPFAAFIETLAKEFTKRGHEVVVVAPQSITKAIFRRGHILPIYSEVRYCDEIIRVYRPKTVTFGGRGFLGKITLNMNRWATCKCVKKMHKSFDVVYAHFWTSAYNILPYAVAENIPLFVATGEDEIYITKQISEKAVKRLKSTTKGVICVSTKNLKESINYNLVDENDCIILPNAINMGEFKQIDKVDARQKLGYNPSDFIVAFVGRFVHRKGSKRVSEAIEKLKDSSIKSIFIGDVTSDVNKDDVPNCSGILFRGKLEHSEIPLYLSAADIFVLPTLAEGCSNSIIEALACGLPIISSDMEFNYDILNSSNSIMLNPLNVDEITQSIRVLKDNPQKRLQMSIAALETAKKLDYSQRIDNILNFIEKRI